MLRLFTTAAVLALTAVSAQAADSLPTRIHDAAVSACAVESSASRPASHYGAITQQCIERISAAAVLKYQTDASARTMASTAAN